MQHDLMILDDVAEVLRISVRTARQWLASGKLPRPVEITRKTHRWRRADVLRWIEQGCPAQRKPAARVRGRKPVGLE